MSPVRTLRCGLCGSKCGIGLNLVSGAYYLNISFGCEQAICWVAAVAVQVFILWVSCESAHVSGCFRLTSSQSALHSCSYFVPTSTISCLHSSLYLLSVSSRNLQPCGIPHISILYHPIPFPMAFGTHPSLYFPLIGI